MKKFSEYKGDDAIELWADLLEPASTIISDQVILNLVQKRAQPLIIAKQILKLHKQEAKEILLRIDNTPITGINMVSRLIDIILDFANSPELQDFLSLASQETGGVSFGSAMENIEAKETSGNSPATSGRKLSEKKEN